ncbi:hypothetical protein NPIL_112081, partial [Nephila pilipes]
MYEIRGTDPETKKTTVLNVYAYWSGESVDSTPPSCEVR